VQIAGTALSLEPTIAQTIAIIVHELATNAAKYGALSVAEGHIKIEWSRSFDRLLILRWTETLGPLVKPPAHRGFGTRVMGTWCATNSRARCASIGGQKDLHAKSPFQPSGTVPLTPLSGSQRFGYSLRGRSICRFAFARALPQEGMTFRNRVRKDWGVCRDGLCYQGPPRVPAPNMDGVTTIYGSKIAHDAALQLLRGGAVG
jgi:hypothetical protein